MVWLEMTSLSEVLKVSAGPRSVRVRSNTIETCGTLAGWGSKTTVRRLAVILSPGDKQVLGLNEVLIDIRSVLAPQITNNPGTVFIFESQMLARQSRVFGKAEVVVSGSPHGPSVAFESERTGFARWEG